jgi:hypothetical protein
MGQKIAKPVTALGLAFEEIEAILVEKMGGFIESDMGISHELWGPNEGFIRANLKLYFDLKKLHEYVAQLPESKRFNWVGLSDDQKEGVKPE